MCWVIQIGTYVWHGIYKCDDSMTYVYMISMLWVHNLWWNMTCLCLCMWYGKFMAMHPMWRYIDTTFMVGLRYRAIRVETYKRIDKRGCSWGRVQWSTGTVDNPDGKGHICWHGILGNVNLYVCYAILVLGLLLMFICMHVGIMMLYILFISVVLLAHWVFSY